MSIFTRLSGTIYGSRATVHCSINHIFHPLPRFPAAQKKKKMPLFIFHMSDFLIILPLCDPAGLKSIKHQNILLNMGSGSSSGGGSPLQCLLGNCGDNSAVNGEAGSPQEDEVRPEEPERKRRRRCRQRRRGVKVKQGGSCCHHRPIKPCCHA